MLVLTDLEDVVGAERRAGGRAVHGPHGQHARQRQPVRRRLGAAAGPRQLATDTTTRTHTVRTIIQRTTIAH